MSILLHRDSTEDNKHTPKGFTSASNNSWLTRDENGNSVYDDRTVLPTSTFVDGSLAPPTEVTGDNYVLIDLGGGAVHANWDGAAYNDHVRFNSNFWINTSPNDGYLCFDNNVNLLKQYTTAGGWAQVGTDTNFANTDLTLTGNRTHDLSGNTLTLDNGQTIIQGAGTTSATKSLLVENSAGTDHLTVFDDGTMAFGKSTASFSIDAEYSHAGGTTFSLKNSNSATNAGAGLSIKNSSNDTVTLQSAAVTRSSKTFKQRAAVLEGGSTVSRMIFNVTNSTISNPFRFLAGGDEEHDCIFNLDKDTGQIVKLDIGSENSANSYYAQSRIQSTLTTTTAGSEDSQMIFQTSDGGSLVTNLELLENKIGFFATTPVVQPSGTGETVGFTAGTGTGVNDDSTFTGNVGSTAYRISDIVKALKNLGLIAQ